MPIDKLPEICGNRFVNAWTTSVLLQYNVHMGQYKLAWLLRAPTAAGEPTRLGTRGRLRRSLASEQTPARERRAEYMAGALYLKSFGLEDLTSKVAGLCLGHVEAATWLRRTGRPTAGNL